MLNALHIILVAFWSRYRWPHMFSCLSLIMHMDYTSKPDFCATATHCHKKKPPKTNKQTKNWASKCFEPAKNIENEQHVSFSNTAVYFITSQKGWGRWGKVSELATEHQTHGRRHVWSFSLRCGHSPSRTRGMRMGEPTENTGKIGKMVGRKSSLKVQSFKALSWSPQSNGRDGL